MGLALISCADMSIALVPIRAVTGVNTAWNTVASLTILTLKIVRSIVDITDTILAVSISIAATPVRLSTSSTYWFVLWTLPIIRTAWFANSAITPLTRGVGPWLITDL